MAFQGIRLAGLFFGCEGGHWEEGESGGYPVAQYLDAGWVGRVGRIDSPHQGGLGDCISILSVLPCSVGAFISGLFFIFLVLALKPELGGIT